jgi:hypothetical protein
MQIPKAATRRKPLVPHRRRLQRFYTHAGLHPCRRFSDTFRSCIGGILSSWTHHAAFGFPAVKGTLRRYAPLTASPRRPGLSKRMGCLALLGNSLPGGQTAAGRKKKPQGETCGKLEETVICG